jgi:hypothetical protein
MDDMRRKAGNWLGRLAFWKTDRSDLYDLDSIKEELLRWVNAKDKRSERQAYAGRELAMNNELEIWELIGEAQKRGGLLPAAMNLSLEGLNLDALSPTLFRLPANTLNVLYLDNNQLTSLPAEIGALTGLTELGLSRNRLTSLPAEIGALTGLTHLSLIDNQLTLLPAEIGALTGLTWLGLNGNQLTSLPAEIGALTGLTQLGLSRNRLTSLPAAIGALTGLTWLGLNGNQLTSLPATLGEIPANANVDVRDNPITSLPENIGQWNGFELQINAGNLPERVLAALQNLPSGPRIDFNMTQAGQAQTVEEDREQSRPLEEAVASWIPEDKPERSEWISRFQAIREQDESIGHENRVKEFSRLLDRIPEMADYKNVNTRLVVEAQVAEVLDLARSDKDGRNMLFETAAKALGTCGDRVAEGWSAMLDVLDSRIAIRDDWPLDKRLECLRGEWLKRHIELKTYELCNRENIRFTDPVEVAIGFKRRLAGEFALPHVMKDMLYPGCAVITDQAMQEMREYLHGLDQTLLVDYVADHPLWTETMKQRQKDALESIEESFGELLEKATNVGDNFGTKQEIPSPVIQKLYDHTPNKGEWDNAAVKEIGKAKDYARRLICLEHAEAALPLTTTRRETAAPEASSSSSQAAPRHAAPSFNPEGGPQDGEAAERRKARLGCLQAFALEQVAKAKRDSYEKKLIVEAGGDPAVRRPAREGDRIPAGSVVSPPLGDASRPETQSVVVVTPEKAVLELTFAQLKAMGRIDFLQPGRTTSFATEKAGFTLKRPLSTSALALESRKRPQRN